MLLQKAGYRVRYEKRRSEKSCFLHILSMSSKKGAGGVPESSLVQKIHRFIEIWNSVNDGDICTLDNTNAEKVPGIKSGIEQSQFKTHDRQNTGATGLTGSTVLALCNRCIESPPSIFPAPSFVLFFLHTPLVRDLYILLISLIFRFN